MKLKMYHLQVSISTVKMKITIEIQIRFVFVDEKGLLYIAKSNSYSVVY